MLLFLLSASISFLGLLRGEITVGKLFSSVPKFEFDCFLGDFEGDKL